METSTIQKYFQDNKTRVDAEHGSLLTPISADMIIFDIAPVRPMDIERIFTRLDKTRSQWIISRKHPEGKTISFRLMTVAVGHNYIAGFEKDQLNERVAYIVYDESGNSKSEIVKQHIGKPYVNIGIQGELTCGDDVYSVSLWVWNKGSIHLTMGLRKGNANKIVPAPSNLAEMQTVFDSIVADLLFVLWDHAISHGNPQLPVPQRTSWKMSNNSFTSMIARPWAIDYNDTDDFKVHVSLMLNYHIMRQAYEGGYIVVGRHDRYKRKDTYFMLDIAFVTFDLLFSSYANITKGPGNNNYTIHGFKINKSYWTEAKGVKTDRGTLKSLAGVFVKTGTLSTSDNKLRVTLVKNGAQVERELLVNIAIMPRVVIKFWKSGKIQMNSFSSEPMLTAWRGLDSLTTALTSTGVPPGLLELSKGHVSAFDWIHMYNGKSVIDASAERIEASKAAGVKVSLGRRGRKPKPKPELVELGPTSASPSGKDIKLGISSIDTRTGRLTIDGKSNNHKTSELEVAAATLGVPIKYDDKRKVYLKSRAEISRDIVMELLLKRGIPAYSGSAKDEAVGHTLSYIRKGWEKEAGRGDSKGETFRLRRALLASIIEKEHKALTVASNKRNGERATVKSPLYRDDIFSPAGRALSRKKASSASSTKNNDRNGVNANFNPNSMTPIKKRYMVLDALFGYSSFDI